MKVLFGLFIIFLFASCNGTDHTSDKQTGGDSSRSHKGSFDSSTNGVQDTSTVIDYDTAARRRH